MPSFVAESKMVIANRKCVYELDLEAPVSGASVQSLARWNQYSLQYETPQNL